MGPRRRPGREDRLRRAANDAGGLDQALNEVVDQHLANIVSNSWGLPESLAPRGEILAMNAVFQQAAAEGIGVYFASGDDGDNRLAAGRISAGFPDSSPWVTSVGGTSLAISRTGGYEWEAGWGTTTTDWNGAKWAPKAPGDFMYGSGGGPSHVFPMPSYQAGRRAARGGDLEGDAAAGGARHRDGRRPADAA